MSTYHVYVGLQDLPQALIQEIHALNGMLVNQSPQPIIISTSNEQLNQDKIIGLFEKHGFNEIEVNKVERP